jgi:hypothetical protein
MGLRQLPDERPEAHALHLSANTDDEVAFASLKCVCPPAVAAGPGARGHTCGPASARPGALLPDVRGS